MTAFYLLAAAFAAVLTLGLQQINVERRAMLAAALTSPLIGCSHWVLFKVLPGPTDWLDFTGYVAGGSAGIVASMWLHPLLVRWFERNEPVHTGADESEWDRLAEMQRIATEISDDAAQLDIRSYCGVDRLGDRTWYDTRIAEMSGNAADVRRALRYLSLRGQLLVHPVQKHLVRIAQ